MNDRDIRKWKDGECHSKDSAKEVDPKHHLLACYVILGEDLILCGIGRPIQSEINQKVPNTNQVGIRSCFASSAT